MKRFMYPVIAVGLFCISISVSAQEENILLDRKFTSFPCASKNLIVSIGAFSRMAYPVASKLYGVSAVAE